MAAYGYIQMERFGFHQMTEFGRKVSTFGLIVGSVALAVVAGIYQNGYTDAGQTCHFLHDYRVSGTEGCSL